MRASSLELQVQIASVPDRDELVAELWAGKYQVAELAQLEGKLVLQLYAAPDGLSWEFGLDDFIRSINELRRQLTES